MWIQFLGWEDPLEEGVATPVFLPGESQDRWAWWATVHSVTRSQTCGFMHCWSVICLRCALTWFFCVCFVSVSLISEFFSFIQRWKEIHLIFLWASLVAQMTKNPPTMCETWVDPWIGKIPWRRSWQPTPVSLPGESYRQKRMAGYSPWDH